MHLLDRILNLNQILGSMCQDLRKKVEIKTCYMTKTIIVGAKVSLQEVIIQGDAQIHAQIVHKDT